MIESALRRIMDHATILEETTIRGSMIKEEEMTVKMTAMEEMKEEELLQVTIKKIIILKRSQNSPGMKLML